MAKTMDFAAGLLFIALAAPINAVGQNPAGTFAFQPGQTFHYRVRLHETTKVMPAPSSLSAPKSAVIESQALIKVEVLSVGGAKVKIRTSFDALSTDTHFRVPNTQGVPPQEERRGLDRPIMVLATFQPGGVVADVQGLSALYPEQQQVWRSWAAAFALAIETQKRMKERVALADIPASLSAFDGLRWTRELEPAGDQACSTYSLGVSREPTKFSKLPGGCAKLTVHEKLLQSPENSAVAQELNRQRDLHSSGSARGKGEIRAQVSKETGCLVRSDGESNLRATARFARTDHSESIEYKSNTRTRVEIRLITEDLLAQTGGISKP